MTPTSTIAIMMKERCVATSAPDSTQIERRHGERGDGGPFLDRRAVGEPGDERQQAREDEKDHAGDDRHVIAGDRQHVADAGDEHGVVEMRVDGVALPVISIEAMAPGSPGSTARMRASMASRMPLHDGVGALPGALGAPAARRS